MGHQVQMFVGRRPVLERYQALVPTLGLFALTPGATLLALPLDEAGRDALHVAYGTGEWPEPLKVMLSTGDLGFAATASRTAPLAYLETDYFGGAGRQSAVAWSAGEVMVGPLTIDSEVQAHRPAAMWPINMALASLHVRPDAGQDAFDAFGLGQWRSVDAIMTRARRVA